MRRLLIILLLTLLPIQASWAAVCAYCPDNCITETAPGASHEAPADDTAAPDSDDDCSRCQAGSAGMAASLPDARFFPHLNILPNLGGSIVPTLAQPDRPERPNWTRAA